MLSGLHQGESGGIWNQIKILLQSSQGQGRRMGCQLSLNIGGNQFFFVLGRGNVEGFDHQSSRQVGFIDLFHPLPQLLPLFIGQ